MTGIAKLLADCAAQGIQLSPGDGGGLAIDAPSAVLTPDLVDRLRRHKAELLAVLGGDDSAAGSTLEWQDDSGETHRVEFADDLADDWEAAIPWPGPSKLPAPPMRPETIMPTRGPRGFPTGCPACGHAEFVDVKIHGGRSLRRDCARCGRFISFPVWFGREQK